MDIKLPPDFDPETYLYLNPDVRRAGMGAEAHYLLHGHKEGRVCHPYELYQRAVHQILTNIDGGFLRVTLNDVDLWLPAATVQTMTHCFHQNLGGRILLKVEQPQLDWIIERLRKGSSHFIDVGAATGAIALPIASQFGSEIAITAFEPSIRNRELLAAAIARNGLTGIDVLPFACADKTGQAPFWEFPLDESGRYPYLPETSSLGSSDDVRARKTVVDVTTLDAQFPNADGISHTVVKVDVEGFEAKVLAGAEHMIAERRPAFAIDIHVNPFGPGTTEADVCALLRPYGYRFERLAHVLVCEA